MGLPDCSLLHKSEAGNCHRPQVVSGFLDYSTIDLNDNFKPGVVPGPFSNAVGGGKQTVYAVGMNWYPNTNLRFMFDYLHGNINKKFSVAAGGRIAGTPLGTPVGGDFDAVVLRSQFAF